MQSRQADDVSVAGTTSQSQNRNAAATDHHEARAGEYGSPPAAALVTALLVDSCSNMGFDEDFFSKNPGIFFRCIGYSHMANIMSGTLGGQMLEVDPETVRYPTANQSGFYLALAVDNFVPVEDFTKEMDGLMDSVGRMQPYPGLDTAQLPGGPEFDCEQANRRGGIPVCIEAQRNLEQIAAEVGVQVPW